MVSMDNIGQENLVSLLTEGTGLGNRAQSVKQGSMI